ncbi:ankyrin repeat family protein [Turkeypox virus]|uniref:Ankyrin repeat family protein n=1 Tax=Turkeypox virus TaxID=336486 RepID=A0A0M3ZJH1_9POXV|nr:ankyrin repeat family protein [Turkeypox virus]ALA62378.1 ankyrin repeat family protein [Turkeypox virus]
MFGRNKKVRSFRTFGEALSLHNAILNNDIKYILNLIEKGIDIDYEDQWMMPALFYAIEYRKLDIVSLLLVNGANVNFLTENRSVLFEHLENSTDSLILDLLIQSGIELFIY